MKRIYSLLIVTSVFCWSCTDFLNESSPSNFTEKNYFKTPEQFLSTVNAMYADLRMSASGDYGGNPYFMTDFATGLAGTRVGQNIHINKVRTLTNDSDNQYSLSWWTSSYRGIANANLVIKYLPDFTMDANTKNRYLGEAYFFRAYYYFNLVRIFGNIPLILTPIDGSSPDLYANQATPEQVYDAIVKDLLEAEKTPLPWAETSGRVTMTAAKSVLAQVYLTMAGYPLQKGQSHYTLAATKAKEVIDQAGRSLFASYADLRNMQRQNAGEHILMIQYQTGVTTNPLQQLWLPFNLDISFYATETGTVYALEEFINSYEPGDKRMEEKEFYYTNFTLNTNRNQTVEFGYYHIFKFFDMDAHLNTAQSSLNHPLLRYADVLLTYAEAQNESGSANDVAYKCVNDIRARANLTPLSGLSQDEFRKAVWRERYHELAFENKIWFDMARTRKVMVLATGDFDDYVGHQFTYGTNLKLSQRELLFPIPTTEMNNNKNLKQNFGYD